MNALLVDIGNSRIKARWIGGSDRGERRVDLDPVALDELDRLADHWQPLAAERIDTAYISNVASVDAEATLVASLLANRPALTIERIVPDARTGGLVNGYRDPARLGPDRWMSLVGAHAMLPARSLLVCGFGTATTLDLLTHDAVAGRTMFVGGFILPGTDAMRSVLLDRTSRLAVGPGANVRFPDNTADAVESGVMLAQLGALRGAWDDARRSTTGQLECVLAGGASHAIAVALEPADMVVHHLADLVLRGLGVHARLASHASVATRA